MKAPRNKTCLRGHLFDTATWRWNGNSWSCGQCRQVTEKARRANKRRKDPAGYILGELRRNAQKRGKNFTIVAADIEPLPTHCPILEVKLDYSGKNGDNAASVDRVDSTAGYQAGNIVVMSKRANRLKSDATADELQKITDYLRGPLLQAQLARQHAEAERRKIEDPCCAFRVEVSRRFLSPPKFKSFSDRRAWIRSNLT